METKNYLGSKGNSGLYQFIINKMPKHDIYIEPFFGTGVIASKKKPSPIDNIGIEVDEKLYSEMTMRYPHFNFFNENSIKTINIMQVINLLKINKMHLIIWKLYL